MALTSPLDPKTAAALIASQQCEMACLALVSYDVKAGRRWVHAVRAFVNPFEAQAYAEELHLAENRARQKTGSIYRRIERHTSFVF